MSSFLRRDLTATEHWFVKCFFFSLSLHTIFDIPVECSSERTSWYCPEPSVKKKVSLKNVSHGFKVFSPMHLPLSFSVCTHTQKKTKINKEKQNINAIIKSYFSMALRAFFFLSGKVVCFCCFVESYVIVLNFLFIPCMTGKS